MCSRTTLEEEEESNNGTTRTPSVVKIEEILGELTDEEEQIEDLFQVLLNLLCENPKWGVSVFGPNGEPVEIGPDGGATSSAHFLALSHPPKVDWSCWAAVQMEAGYAFFCMASVYLAGIVGATLVLYVGYKAQAWFKERQLRLQQETFELVEQALSLLVAQQQQARATSPSGATPDTAWVAVSHVRDQLIPPAERRRRRHAWDRAVRYIREQESRVREEVRRIYGEEHRVWRWVPEIHWTPGGTPAGLAHHPGPNPYLTPSPSLFKQLKQQGTSPVSALSNNATTIQWHHSASPTTPSSFASVPPSTSVSSSSPWQGSAFNSLSKNVAAPAVAPTSCVKVRHLFDHSTGPASGSGWIWRVKEELLRRCAASSAAILHVAVDTESNEGCVYAKCASAEHAGRVFRALHGQWYRGNLVTVKYLREERYHERFPDAKGQTKPMRPQM